MEGIKYINLVKISCSVMRIQGVENGKLVVPANNILVCSIFILAADT